MRFFLILLISFLSSTSLLAQQNTLRVQVENNISKEFFLADFYGDLNNMVDTAMVDSTGLAVFYLPEGTPSGMYRVILSTEKFIDLIFNKEDIFIKTDFNDIYESLFVETSVENQIYYDYLRTRHDYRRKYDLLTPINDYYPRTDSFFHVARGQFIGVQAEIQVYINDVVELYPDAWATRIMKVQRPLFYDPSMDDFGRRSHTKEHFFDNFDFNDIELIKSNVYTSAAIQYMSLYSNPNLNQEQLEQEFILAVDKIMYEAMDNSMVYEFIVEYLVGGFQQYQFEKVLDYIAETYTPDQCENEERKSDLQTRLEKYAELTIGKPGPNFTAKTPDGDKVVLSKIKTDYTLVIFWASWCPHCTDMIPEIHRLYESSINHRDVSIVAFSIDKSEEEWKAALAENQTTWINASELLGWESQAAIDYNIYATPSMFLLDKDKNILAKPITFDALITALTDENIIK